MAAEQDWAAYADQSILEDADTILARTSAGAGVEIPGSALVKKDASGNVGIGTSSPTHKLQVSGGASCLRVSGDNLATDVLASFGGLGLILVDAPGTAGGRIEVSSDNLTIGIIPRPSVDNFITLGSASNRWSVVYAGTGTINTSDEREKTWRGGLSDAEYAAALKIIDELGFYQWNDSIAEKGSDARLHFGARAQRVFAMLDEHLGEDEWHRYAFACHDSWGDEFGPVFEERLIPAVLNESGEEIEPERTEMVDTGQTRKTLEAGDRYGLREGQFTMFLLAAQARRQNELEQRIAALEA